MEMNEVVDVAALSTTAYYFGVYAAVFAGTVGIYVFLRKVRPDAAAAAAAAAAATSTCSRPRARRLALALTLRSGGRRASTSSRRAPTASWAGDDRPGTTTALARPSRAAARAGVGWAGVSSSREVAL
eukprot:scaffold1852_cov282-Prasinococcus_capsulatus_cf.AAC.7